MESHLPLDTTSGCQNGIPMGTGGKSCWQAVFFYLCFYDQFWPNEDWCNILVDQPSSVKTKDYQIVNFE